MAGMLERLANVMRTQIERTPGHKALWRRLGRGLIVLLERQADGRWRLALGRDDTFPSPQEIQICQRAFRVPEGTTPKLRIDMRPSKKSQDWRQSYVAEMFW